MCYCECCQRATSAPFAAFIVCVSDQVKWEGPLTHFESSLSTQRGFCSACGARMCFVPKNGRMKSTFLQPL
uniref:GFA family protein n=1 Tax=Shimia gijangensis TaxID=1470563 RepID=UPI00389A7F74